jgi:hypothetical protein
LHPSPGIGIRLLAMTHPRPAFVAMFFNIQLDIQTHLDFLRRRSPQATQTAFLRLRL